MKPKSPHWSSQNLQAYRMAVLASFLTQIQNRLDVLGWHAYHLAERSGISQKRITQILSQDVTPTLTECMIMAKSASCSIAIVAIPNHDDVNLGPINSEVFHSLWYKAMRPLSVYDVDDLKITEHLPRKIEPKKGKKK